MSDNNSDNNNSDSGNSIINCEKYKIYDNNVIISIDELPNTPFRELLGISANENVIDTPIENNITAEIISRYNKAETSPYWDGFDLCNANRYQLKEYILARATFDKNAPIPDRMHYLIYMIVNKINGKIYIGQHQTDKVWDNYMGSGEVINIAEKKYGIENFEKIIIYNCETWEEMDRYERLIVTNIFRRKWDEVYNRAIGGFDGNTSEKQKLAFKEGRVTSAVKNKILYHTKDNVVLYIDKNETNIPEGLIKGQVETEKRKKNLEIKIKLCKEIEEALKTIIDKHGMHVNTDKISEMHISDLERKLKQIAKYKQAEEERKIYMHEAFEYYKTHGKDETFRKFKYIKNRPNFEHIIELYFPEEWYAYMREEEAREKQ